MQAIYTTSYPHNNFVIVLDLQMRKTGVERRLTGAWEALNLAILITFFCIFFWHRVITYLKKLKRIYSFGFSNLTFNIGS